MSHEEMPSSVDAHAFDALYRYLAIEAAHCIRPPVDRFSHPWIAPMAPSPANEQLLRQRHDDQRPAERRTGFSGVQSDLFAAGDYGLGLFHHDASESAIEWLQHPRLLDAAAGTLLCFLECASPDGCIHRTELPHKAREREPAKPVMAQYALRVVRTMGTDGVEWARQYRVFERIEAFIAFLERNYTGMHGLMITQSPRASGFDSDIISASRPDRCVEGPDTSAFMVLEYEAAAELAVLVGSSDAARSLQQRAERLRTLMNRLMWHEDEAGGFYVGLQWHHGVGNLDGEYVSTPDVTGRLRPLESWISFLPLYAGIPDEERAAHLIRRLVDPATYWGPRGVRTLPANDVFFHQAPRIMLYDERRGHAGPVSNWCGPVWVLSNYYIAAGLKQYGHADKARELALATARLLANDLEATGMLHESYDDDGRGLWPRAGSFISWNVLALAMLREHAPELTRNWTIVST